MADAWPMLRDCFAHQQGAEPTLSWTDKYGNCPPESIPYTPELAINQDDMPPAGYARSFELQVGEAGYRPPDPTAEPYYWD